VNLAMRGREAEGWLTKVNQAHPNPPPGLGALAHGTWAAYYVNRGSVGLSLEHNRLARQAVSDAAGQDPLFPMLAQLHLQEVGAHLMAGDLPAAAAAFQHAPAPMSAPIVDEFRSPLVAAWVAFLQGDLVSAGAALDRVGGAAAEYDAVPHGVGHIVANLTGAGIHLERHGRRHGSTAARSCRPSSTPGSPGWPPSRGIGRARWRRWPRCAWPWPCLTSGSGHSSRSRSSASRSPWRLPKQAR
jgi:hypothetical protein